MSSQHRPPQDLHQQLLNFDPASCPTDSSRRELLSAARALCSQLEKPMETLLRMVWIEPAYAACLKLGVDVGLFAALGEKGEGREYSVEELAGKTGVERDLLERILRMLANMGTVAQVGDDTFWATDHSEALIARPCSAAVDFRYLIVNPMIQHLPTFLKETNYRNPSDLTGGNFQAALRTEFSAFEWLGQNPEPLDAFANLMAGYTSQRGTWEDVYPIRERLLDGAEDLEGMQDLLLVDVGGGAGHDLKRFASSFVPTSNKECLILLDLPEVIDQAKASGTLPQTIRAETIDFTKEAPIPGARGYFMHSVLHDWPDDIVRQILRQMHPTLSQTTAEGRTPKLLLNENVLLKRGVQPQPAALDVIMMAAFASHERSEEQWRALLESAGYRVTAIFSKSGIDEAVIEAEAVESVE